MTAKSQTACPFIEILTHTCYSKETSKNTTNLKKTESELRICPL